MYIDGWPHPSWCKNIGRRRNGFVQREIELLSEVPQFTRVLFPSNGQVQWKTGFWVLAKELNAVVVLIGIDHFQKKVTIDSILPVTKNTPFEEIKFSALQRLRLYSPHFMYLIWYECFGYGCETNVPTII